MPVTQNTTDTAISVRFTTLEHTDAQLKEEDFIFESGVVKYEFIRERKIKSTDKASK